MSGTQDASGNALEYALARYIARVVGVPLVKDDISEKAAQDFMTQSCSNRRWLLSAAKKSILHIMTVEESVNWAEGREVFMQSDGRGQVGDPRDIVLSLAKGNLGISAKRNNDVAKNPRVQRHNSDFGKKWNLGASVSAQYREKVEEVFGYVDLAKKNGAINWKDMGSNLHQCVYAPMIAAFGKEFKSLCKDSNICKQFIRYMVGNCDYYKIMVYPNQIIVQGYNLHGNLSCAKLSFPKSLLSVVPKSGANNTTIILSFDGGWVFSMRIHSARTKLENSLKWDVRMTAHPSNLYSRSIL